MLGFKLQPQSCKDLVKHRHSPILLVKPFWRQVGKGLVSQPIFVRQSIQLDKSRFGAALDGANSIPLVSQEVLHRHHQEISKATFARIDLGKIIFLKKSEEKLLSKV